MAFVNTETIANSAVSRQEKEQNSAPKRVRRRSENRVLVEVQSENVKYLPDSIISSYDYETVSVSTTARAEHGGEKHVATPMKRRFRIKTDRRVKRTGVLLVGIGGNNGTTLVGGLLANKRKVEWMTKEGARRADWLGSIMETSTMKLGNDYEANKEVYVPLYSMLPTVNPNDIVVHGWDFSSLPLGDAMRRARVFDIALQDKLYDEMQQTVPMPSIYHPEFIAENQRARVDNILAGTPQEQLDRLREQIRTFKQTHSLEKVIVLWTANTERCSDVVVGVNDTAENVLTSIKEGKVDNIPPSVLYCVAAIQEGCSYINGSPQNTFVPGIIELAEESVHGVFLGGDDFKSGQTKLKSVLVDFLVSAAIKPMSIVSYNHLGNNDGCNLSSAAQFRSKEISKSNVITDMVRSNSVLFNDHKEPDHCVVIKYVPHLGDSKRALDEYTSEIFMGGSQTFVIHNTCEDSLLAAPIILDLIVLTELCERITLADDSEPATADQRMHTMLSVLSYLTKAPMVPSGTPVVNALGRQKDCILNFLRACLSLPPESNMLLEYKLRGASYGNTAARRGKAV